MILVRASVIGPVVFAAVLASFTARADDEAHARQAALKDFQTGMQQIKSGDAEGARISFARSFASWPTIDALQNLAASEVSTNHCVDALTHLRMYVRNREADPAFVKNKVARLIDRCNEQVGHLRIGAEADAVVSVDGRSVPDLREPVEVTPGPHVVVAKRLDHEDAQHVDVAAGQTVNAVFPAPAPQESVTTQPPTGLPPTTDLRPGTDPRTDLALPPPVESGRPPAQAWATLGLAAGAAPLIALSAYLFVAATDSSSDADRLRTSIGIRGCPASAGCSQLNDAIDAHNQRLMAGYVLGGGGLVLAVGAAAVWFWPIHGDRTTRAAAVVPLLDAHRIGLACSSTF